MTQLHQHHGQRIEKYDLIVAQYDVERVAESPHGDPPIACRRMAPDAVEVTFPR
jgi:hypothetical protein